MIKRNPSHLLWGMVCILLLAACDELQLESKITVPDNRLESEFFYPLQDNTQPLAQEKSIYIPIYSEIFVAGGGRLSLATTLSIRNTDTAYPLIVNKVSYYNTAGKLIENYLAVPYLLKPLAATHFFVSQTDGRGGAGANFIVKWAINQLANKPIVEAVMAGSSGTQGMSFMSVGREIINNQSARPSSEEK